MGDDLERLKAATTYQGIQCKWVEGQGNSGITTNSPTEEQAKIIQNLARTLGFEAEIEKTRGSDQPYHIIVVKSPKPFSPITPPTDATQLKAVQQLKSETLVQRNTKVYEALPDKAKIFNRQALPGDFFVFKKTKDSYEILIKTDKGTENQVVTSQDNLSEKIELAKKNPYVTSDLRKPAEKLQQEYITAHGHCQALNEKDAKESLSAGHTNFCIWPSETEPFGYEFFVQDEKGLSKKHLVLPGNGLHEQLAKATGLSAEEIDFQWKTGETSKKGLEKFSSLQKSFSRQYPKRAQWSNLPGQEEIKYDKKTGYPVFDDKWNNLTQAMMGKSSTLEDKKMYLAIAQVLLNRVCDKVPSLKDPKNESAKQMHPTLMLMALHLAFKTTEDLAVWNADLHSLINGITFSTQELHQMEKAFLHAIDYEIQIPRKELIKYQPIINEPEVPKKITRQKSLPNINAPEKSKEIPRKKSFG